MGELGGPAREAIPLGRVWLAWSDFAQSWWAMLRGPVIRFYFGVLPAAGATVASFMSCDVEKRLAKDPSTFGKGDIRGVAAPESSNNAAAVLTSSAGRPPRTRRSQSRQTSHLRC